MKSYRFLVSGRVQGVWYRANVQKNAQMSGFNGYVKNRKDGNVEAVVTCEKERLEKFISILKKGSPLSRVKTIVQSETDEVLDGGFVIR
ncbi:MAG: acylphosphatase [Helicobacteraceae bacterium 4484_230]|nr:MAG: acylphosphatase [Helicobacteraceae bacterium 4484_230]